MTSPGDRPLQPAPDERRRRLVRHFAATVEPLLTAGRSYPELSVRELIEHRRTQGVDGPAPWFGDNDGLSARVAVAPL